MVLSPADFLDEFGGRWDGHSRELHGLIVRNGERYKVEVLQKDDGRVLVSVFENGNVKFSEASSAPIDSLRRFWTVS